MRPTPPGVWLSQRGVAALALLAVLLGIGGVVPWMLAVFAVACTALAGALAADLALGPRAAALRIARRPLENVTVRRGTSLTYDVENRSTTACTVGLVETNVAILDFADGDRPQRIAARTSVTFERAVTARERGIAHLGDLYAWTENPIGLLRRRYRIAAAHDVRVNANLSAVESYGTLARRNTLRDAGLRRLRMRGAGREFESVRDYQAGDAFGVVDWKATARRGRLMVAQYQAERSQQVIVALDCGRLMTPRIGPQRKFEYALTAALSVARIAADAGDNVGLEAFAARPLLGIAPRRGSAHTGALVRATLELQPRFEEPDYEAVFARLRRRYTKRSLVVLFTDIFDPVTSAAVLAGMQALVPRHLAMCVLMNDAAIAHALDDEPHTVAGAYRTAVAMKLADERARAIAILRARGIITIDVPADRLTVALLDAYLDVKARGLL